MLTRGAEVAARAREWLGTPYCHQASRRGAGTDCLGLLRGIWREIHGCEPQIVPPYTADWGEFGAREILLEAARRHLVVARGAESLGEVLVFRMWPGAIAKHLGILSACGPAPSFIHAYERHGVVESPLSTPWRQRIAGRFRFPE